MSSRSVGWSLKGVRQILKCGGRSGGFVYSHYLQTCLLSGWVARQRLLMPYLVPYGYGAAGMAPRAGNSQRRSLPWQVEGLLKHKGLSDVALASSTVILYCKIHSALALIENTCGKLLVCR